MLPGTKVTLQDLRHADAWIPKQLVFGSGLADPAVTNRHADPWPATIARTLPMCTYTCLWTVLQVEFSCASKAELSSFVSTRSNPVSLGLPLYRRSSAELNGRVFS